MTKLLQLFAGTALGLAAGSAQALTTFNFSYDFGDQGKVVGTLAGTLLSDNNTIAVSAINRHATVSAPGNTPVAGPALPLVTTIAAYLASLPTTPQVTRDGSHMELLGCDSIYCSEGLFFDTTGVFGGPIAVVGYGEQAMQAAFDANSWSIAAAVPEPASWALMIAGFGLTGAALRRRRIAVAA